MPRRARMGLLAAVLVGPALRLTLAAVVAPERIAGDPRTYDGTATAIAAGRGYSVNGRPTAVHPREILGVVVASPALATASVAGFAILAALAALGLLTRAVRRAPLWLWTAPGLLWLSTAPFAVNFSRLRWPLDPFLVLPAACSLIAVARRARLHRTASV